jgi:hypothetical protein
VAALTEKIQGSTLIYGLTFDGVKVRLPQAAADIHDHRPQLAKCLHTPNQQQSQALGQSTSPGCDAASQL